MKNISSPITLSFYGKTNLSRIRYEGKNVFAVYGSNGMGKSSIILSVLFAKGLMTVPNYLATDRAKNIIKMFLNKETKSFSIELLFAVYDEKNQNKTKGIFSYQLELDVSEDNRATIVYESINRVKENRISGNRECIFCADHGSVTVNSKNDSKVGEFIKEKTMNLLSSSTFISQISQILREYSKGKDDKAEVPEIIFSAANVFIFAANLYVHLEDEDENKINQSAEESIEYLKGLNPDDIKNMLIQGMKASGGDNVVKKSDFERFKSYVDKLYEFLHLFKPSLQRIDIETKEDKDLYYCSKTLVYPNSRISESCESTGIKKLINLYTYFETASSGSIVLIDELDANISGPYLNALIQYFLMYGKGQLIFTAHSMEPMKVLGKRNSIFFIGEDNFVSSWANSGHSKPYILYPEGMIKGSPFNIQPFDYLSVFSAGDDDLPLIKK